MKLTTIFMLIVCIHVNARGFSQTVSFSGKDVSLQSVFSSLEKQTGLSFFFNYALLKDAKPVTLEVRDVSIEDALKEVLKDEGLDFYRTGKTIFIVRKKDSSPAVVEKKSDSTPDQQVDVKGRVVNSQGEPLVGASIALVNGKKGTLTNEKGMFELRGVPVGTKLEISYAGYSMRSVEVTGNEQLRVELTLANDKLDEAQVIAYGNTTQRFNVGNVTTVKAAVIEKQLVTNPLLALEGRVPGLFITQSTGLPGTGVTVRIGGQNSLTKGNDPLYVVDGVPYTSQLLPTLASILGTSGVGLAGTGSGNPLSFINPADIESIDVLKDADATAIYGSRAANGAILITTKKGKTGNTLVNINAQNGWGTVPRKLHLLNLRQYLQMRHEAQRNDGISTPAVSDYDINGTWDSTRSTDWQKTLLGGKAQYTDMQASASGGNGNTQFLVGGGYHRETTPFPGNLSDQKGSLHFTLNNASANQKFHLQLSASYMVDDNQLISTDFTGTAMKLAPDAPPLYTVAGGLNWAPLANVNSTWANPLATLYRTYGNKTNNLIGNGVLSYLILPDLYVKTSLGYTNLVSNETQIFPLLSDAPEIRPLVKGSANFANSQINSWIIEPQLNYRHYLSKGKLDIVIGSTIQQNNSYNQKFSGTNYNTDAQLQDIHSAANVTVTSTVNSTYKYNAAFGRINYNWQDKYIVDFTARRDGSSRFGPQNQFHNFASAAAGWIFSNEPLMKNIIPAVSFGKLKVSYGTTGNDQIGDYTFLNLYNNLTSAVPYQGVNGLTSAGIYNPYLQWETTKKFQVGLDIGLLKDRILLSATYDQNRSSNELLQYALPIIAGFASINPVNFPATIQNSDWEFSISADIIKGRNFSWATYINLTIPQNRLISFPNIAQSTYATTYVVGQPFTITKVYHLRGVDPATGVYQFSDAKGGISFRPDTASTQTKSVIINSAPKLYGGLGNTFRYKGFELDFLFQAVKQIGNNYYFGNSPGQFFGTSNSGNQPNYVLARWQKTW